jgi:4-hydroxy-L-threonine phosphate dehydrogenase PdxA
LNFKGLFSEMNVLDNQWVTRATSHVSLREAVEQISIERTMLMARIEKPRIAVAALNPHADTGAYEAAIRLAARIAARKKSSSGSIAA